MSRSVGPIDPGKLVAAVALYRAGRPLGECCVAFGLEDSESSRSRLLHRLGRMGIQRTWAENVANIRARWAERAAKIGQEPGRIAAGRRKSKKWGEKAVASGRCYSCGKPRERLRHRCDACQRVNNITTLIRRYAKAGVALTRKQAKRLTRVK